jgi:hypothetical protein
MLITKKTDRDFYFTDDGDILFDEIRGDFKVVNHKDNLNLFSQIIKRIQSKVEDWNISGIVTTRFDSIIGLSINNDVLRFIEDDITIALLSGGLLFTSEFMVEAEAINREFVMITIQTKSSDPKRDKPVRLVVTYDVRMSQIIPRFSDIRDLKDGNIYNS